MTIITYKTAMAGNTLDFDQHTMTAVSYEDARAIAYDLENGDFGELICFDIEITEPEPETIDDLPF